MTTLTEQQKARIVDLAEWCEHLLSVTPAMTPTPEWWAEQAQHASAEAFRIAQGAT